MIITMGIDPSWLVSAESHAVGGTERVHEQLPPQILNTSCVSKLGTLHVRVVVHRRAGLHQFEDLLHVPNV